MIKDDLVTRRILSVIREGSSTNENKILTEEAVKGDDSQKSFPITKNTPQFSDVRISQEETLVKTIGESVELDEKALMYYPDNKDLVLSGKINALSLAFQFRYNDPSGDGLYIWCNALQLTETNSRTLGKIRDAFVNWKNSLIQDGDLMEKLFKAANK